jgi:hypothetical protein
MAMNANEDVRTGTTDELFQALGMKEAILTWHASKSPPATYNWNLQRHQIDGIWVTPGLKAVGAGYCPLGEGCPPSDHRVLWIDLSYEQPFGYKLPYLKYPDIRQLHSRDPQITVKYNKK